MRTNEQEHKPSLTPAEFRAALRELMEKFNAYGEAAVRKSLGLPATEGGAQ